MVIGLQCSGNLEKSGFRPALHTAQAGEKKGNPERPLIFLRQFQPRWFVHANFLIGGQLSLRQSSEFGPVISG
jgi:hypothetical protein